MAERRQAVARVQVDRPDYPSAPIRGPWAAKSGRHNGRLPALGKEMNDAYNQWLGSCYREGLARRSSGDS